MPACGQQGALIFSDTSRIAYFASDLPRFKTFKIWERQSVQLRVSATDTVPISGSSSRTIPWPSSARQGGDQSSPGKPGFKTGRRIMTFALQHYF